MTKISPPASPDVLAIIYQTQFGPQAAMMKLTLSVEQRGSAVVGENVGASLDTVINNSNGINAETTKLWAKVGQQQQTDH